MRTSTFLSCILFLGCSSLHGSSAGGFSGSKFKKNKVKHLRPISGGAYRTPCINLPFIDKNFPELLGEVIRLYNPKVDPVGAYKISRLLVKKEGKGKTHVIDTGSVKLCRLGPEMGYSFKAIKVSK